MNEALFSQKTKDEGPNSSGSHSEALWRVVIAQTTVGVNMGLRVTLLHSSNQRSRLDRRREGLVYIILQRRSK